MPMWEHLPCFVFRTSALKENWCLLKVWLKTVAGRLGLSVPRVWHKLVPQLLGLFFLVYMIQTPGFENQLATPLSETWVLKKSRRLSVEKITKFKQSVVPYVKSSHQHCLFQTISGISWVMWWWPSNPIPWALKREDLNKCSWLQVVPCKIRKTHWWIHHTTR